MLWNLHDDKHLHSIFISTYYVAIGMCIHMCKLLHELDRYVAMTGWVVKNLKLFSFNCTCGVSTLRCTAGIS